jgi:hypothetical protein
MLTSHRDNAHGALSTSFGSRGTVEGSRRLFPVLEIGRASSRRVLRCLRAALRGSMPASTRQRHYPRDGPDEDATKRDREFIAGLAAQGPRLGDAGATPPFTWMNLKAAFVRSSRQEPSVGRRQLSLICGLLNLQRARLIDPIDAALDEPLVPRRFPQSTPLQHFQEPCEWQTRWQVSSPSSRRPIPHGGLSRG